MRDFVESDVLPDTVFWVKYGPKEAAWRVGMNLQEKLCGILEKRVDDDGKPVENLGIYLYDLSQYLFFWLIDDGDRHKLKASFMLCFL